VLESNIGQGRINRAVRPDTGRSAAAALCFMNFASGKLFRSGAARVLETRISENAFGGDACGHHPELRSTQRAARHG
jgi:hypothetical protein